MITLDFKFFDYYFNIIPIFSFFSLLNGSQREVKERNALGFKIKFVNMLALRLSLFEVACWIDPQKNKFSAKEFMKLRSIMAVRYKNFEKFSIEWIC